MRSHGDNAALRQELVSAHFTSEADRWKEIYEAGDVQAVVHQHRHHLVLGWIRGMRLPEGSRVLVVGCGTGVTALSLAERGFRVEATDVVEAMLVHARRLAAEAGVTERMAVRRADAHDLPHGDASFDVVLALGVLPWLHSPLRAGREMVRVLRPGGHLVLNVGNRHRLTWLTDPLYNPVLAGVSRRILHPFRRLRDRREAIGSFVDVWVPEELDDLVAEIGAVPVRSATHGFGPVTLFGRRVLPHRIGVALHRALQRLADRGVPLLRGAGAQYSVLARKPADVDHAAG